MADLFEEPAGSNALEFTVSEIAGRVKKLIEGEFGHVRIRGELGRVSRPPSGHLYLDLKDGSAVLSGVIWKGVASRLPVRPEEGMEVVATGRLTTFPGQSRYQLIIEHLAPAGVGALMAMLDARKKALAAEGLFDAARKKQIPYLPEVIGVVTSPSGAVIRDILHRLRDRFPRKVLIWPVAVQGEKCAAEVTAAINGFNALPKEGPLPRPDLLIVARGGGSVEDLWGFNEENVVRAAAASQIPLISAVGHETDTTLIDFAADQRAPTPTAAAELAVPVRSELLSSLADLDARRLRAMTQLGKNRKQRLNDLARALPRPDELVSLRSQRLDGLSHRLPGALKAGVQRKTVQLSRSAAGLRPGLLVAHVRQKASVLARFSDRLLPALEFPLNAHRTKLAYQKDRLRPALVRRIIAEKSNRLEAISRLIDGLSYRATLRRGFAVVRDPEGRVVSSVSAASSTRSLAIEFADGEFSTSAAPEKKPARRSAKTKKPKDKQGSLF